MGEFIVHKWDEAKDGPLSRQAMIKKLKSEVIFSLFGHFSTIIHFACSHLFIQPTNLLTFSSPSKYEFVVFMIRTVQQKNVTICVVCIDLVNKHRSGINIFPKGIKPGSRNCTFHAT